MFSFLSLLFTLTSNVSFLFKNLNSNKFCISLHFQLLYMILLRLHIFAKCWAVWFSRKRAKLELGSITCQSQCVCVSHSVVSYSLQSHGLKPARLLCPWDFPGNHSEQVFSLLLSFPIFIYSFIEHPLSKHHLTSVPLFFIFPLPRTFLLGSFHGFLPNMQHNLNQFISIECFFLQKVSLIRASNWSLLCIDKPSTLVRGDNCVLYVVIELVN